jgi:hypothetical protein
MDEKTAERYRKALSGAGNPVEAAAAAARFAGVEVDATTLELIATAVLGHADSRLGTRQGAPRHMWEIEGYRHHCRQAMRRELHETVTSQGYVPVTLPAETVRYLRMAPPSFGAEVPETADWDTAEITLEVPVRTPPVNRTEAVRRGLLTGSGSAAS